MRKCVSCNTRYKRGSEVTFHKFPTDSTKQLWLQNMKIDNLTLKANELLCSKHFTVDCFIKHTSRTVLKSGSVPNIFLEQSGNKVQTLPLKSEPAEPPDEGCQNPEFNPIILETVSYSSPNPSIIKTEHDNVIAPIPFVSATTTGIKRKLSNVINIHLEDCTLPLKSEPVEPSDEGCQDPEVHPIIRETVSHSSPNPSIIKMDCTWPLKSEPVEPPDESCQDREFNPRILETVSYSSPNPSIIKTEHDNVIAPIPFVSATTTGIKRKLSNVIDIHLEEPITNVPRKKPRTIYEVCKNIKHDHVYENTLSSEEALQRVKESLKMSRARTKVFSQHVKRLKLSVSRLKAVISDLKKQVKR